MVAQRCWSPRRQYAQCAQYVSGMIATRSPSTTRRHTRPDRNHVTRELVAEDLRILRAGQRMRLHGGHDRPGDVLV